jgi:hypothetical protein
MYCRCTLHAPGAYGIAFTVLDLIDKIAIEIREEPVLLLGSSKSFIKSYKNTTFMLHNSKYFNI